MMRLLCNGECLDLPEGVKLTLEKVNPLFAFDNISCERTTEFQLPATRTNNRIFDMAKYEAFYGSGMRRKYNAQLQNGTIVKNGYLYVTKYNKGCYYAVFVCGELIKLKAITDAGSIADNVVDLTTLYWGGSGASAGANTTNYSALLYDYTNTQGNRYIPSVKASHVLDLCASKFGVSIAYPEAIKYLRILPPSPFSVKKLNFNYKTQHLNGNYANVIQLDNRLQDIIVQRESTVAYIVENQDLQKVVRQYRTNNNISLTFPKDFSDSYFVVCMDEMNEIEGEFFGDYSFHKMLNADNTTTTTITGTPLKGRTINIPKENSFLILNINHYFNNMDSSLRLTKGWNLSDTTTLEQDFIVELQGTEEAITTGEYIRLQDNLPECTVVDLLKTVAALSGKVLNYTDEDGITFDDLNVSTWNVIDISKKLTKKGEMSRTFCEYGQKNIIDFNTHDGVPTRQRLSIHYDIPNDNIEEEVELQTIPFSECGLTSRGGYDCVQVRNEDNIYGFGWSLMCATTDGNNFCERVALVKNSRLQGLCDSSTSLTVSINASMVDAERIKPKTRILLNGTMYVWTALNWSNGVATLNLSKI